MAIIELQRVFESREFLQHLGYAGNLSREHGAETRFNVERKLSKDGKKSTGCTEFKIGDDSGFCFPKEVVLKGSGLDHPTFEVRAYPLVMLHFHPGYTKPIVPSGIDGDLGVLDSLVTLLDEDNIHAKPIEAICQIYPNSRIDLLLIQQKSYRPIPQAILREVDEAISSLVGLYQVYCLSHKPSVQDMVIKELQALPLYNVGFLTWSGRRYLPKSDRILEKFNFDEKL